MHAYATHVRNLRIGRMYAEKRVDMFNGKSAIFACIKRSNVLQSDTAERRASDGAQRAQCDMNLHV